MLILNETNQTRQLSLIFEFSILLQLLTNLICSKNVGREREKREYRFSKLCFLPSDDDCLVM